LQTSIGDVASHTSDPCLSVDGVMPRWAGRLEDGQPASAMANGTLAQLIGEQAAEGQTARLSDGIASRCKAIGK